MFLIEKQFSGKRAESVQSHYQPKSPTDTKQNRVSSAPSKSEKPRKSIRIDVNETTKVIIYFNIKYR